MGANRWRRGRQSNESGQVMVLIVLALGLFLLGAAGFSVDMGNLWFHRQSAQNAADAACMAGAMDILVKARGLQQGTRDLQLVRPLIVRRTHHPCPANTPPLTATMARVTHRGTMCTCRFRALPKSPVYQRGCSGPNLCSECLHARGRSRPCTDLLHWPAERTKDTRCSGFRALRYGKCNRAGPHRSPPSHSEQFDEGQWIQWGSQNLGRSDQERSGELWLNHCRKLRGCHRP